MKSSLRTSLVDNPYLKALIGAAVLLLVVFIFPHPESTDYSYQVGSVWLDRDLIATFSCPIYKDLRIYEKERADAMRSVYPVFERRDDVVRPALDSLRSLFRGLANAGQIRQRWLRTGSEHDSLLFMQISSTLAPVLTPGEWMVWDRLTRASARRFTLSQLETKLAGALEGAYRMGVYDPFKVKGYPARIALRRGNEEEIIPRDRLLSTEAAVADVVSLPPAWNIAKEERSLLQKLLGEIVRPNLVFSEDETTMAVQAAEEGVPRTLGIVEENSRIVSKGDRITDETRLKLDSYRRARAERGAEFSEWKHWIGIVFHALLILGLYSVYIYLFRKKIFHDNGKLAVIGLIVLFEAFLAYLSVAISGSAPIQYLIIVPAASMLLTIIFDSRVAFYGTVTVAFLVSGIRGNDYGFALTSMIAGAMAAYTVRDIRNRTQIFRSIGFIFAGYALSIAALSLEEYDRTSQILIDLTFALANAIASPVVTYGLLILFERAFSVTTDLRLLELTNLNHPLLRRLAEEAPGTFHHSMMIGNLAEAAADAVGANSILARVGGYYHDIGKLLKPEYFVENQVGSQNKHTRLKPRMSALIIQSHVKEGMELARDHNLPEIVIDFIPQHHGTSRIAFFYDKAVKAAARRPTKDVINEEDFRYPGPRPQTREAAIIMLADSVEASTRVLAEYSPLHIRKSIEKMVQQRFVEGQLDECELTLRDLSQIQDAFYSILLGTYHQRIVYPDQLAAEPAADQQVGDVSGAETLPAEAPGAGESPADESFADADLSGKPEPDLPSPTDAPDAGEPDAPVGPPPSPSVSGDQPPA